MDGEAKRNQMQTAYLIFTALSFAGIAGAVVWLHRRMLRRGDDNVPYWRIMFLVFTYGAGLYAFLSIALFWVDTSSTSINSATPIGFFLELFVPVLYMYVIFIAPIVILVIGVKSFVEKGNSIYHRVVYFACAGYTFFLLALFMLMVSRCEPPHGGPP
jgi:hypothetical protein